MSRIGEVAFEPVIRRVLACACILLSAAALSGCGAVDMIKGVFFPRLPKVELGDIQVLSDSNANLNTALQLEIVFVKDPELLKKLSEISAARWFASRDDLRKTYPGGFESTEWELVPGQDLRVPREKFKDKRALAVMIFANYLTPGAHRARIDSYRNGVVIHLMARGFTVTARGDAAQGG
jgi:type VI secretion system protein